MYFFFRLISTSDWVFEDRTQAATSAIVQWSPSRALWEVETPGMQAMTRDIMGLGL